LIPRPPPGPESFPPGVTLELEKKWLAKIRAANKKPEEDAKKQN
jgi:hypothetical protein